MSLYRRCIRIISPLGFAALVSLACGSARTTPATQSRIANLTQQEQQLRSSVADLESRQDVLRREIQRAQAAAETARCQAKRDEVRATTAALFAQYSMRYAESQGCKADAAKGGSVMAALGCGLGFIITGPWGLAICTGAAGVGMMAGTGCDDAPPVPSPEDVQREALASLNLRSVPRCAGDAQAYGTDNIATHAKGGAHPTTHPSRNTRNPSHQPRPMQPPSQPTSYGVGGLGLAQPRGVGGVAPTQSIEPRREQPAEQRSGVTSAQPMIKPPRRQRPTQTVAPTPTTVDPQKAAELARANAARWKRDKARLRAKKKTSKSKSGQGTQR